VLDYRFITEFSVDFCICAVCIKIDLEKKADYMANQPTTFSDNDLVRGIDVSHHQSIIDWQKVASYGIVFAFAKATEGVGLQDTHFTANYAAMKSSGILRGAYHFFHPGSDASAQANSFLRVVKQLEPGDLPPTLDVEVDDGKSDKVIINGIQQWLDSVEAALGQRPIIYTSASFWNSKVSGTSRFADYPLWVAHYTFKPNPNIPNGFEDYTIWQFTELGTIDGIDDNNVDLNRFNGTLEDLRKLAGL
jgi:lysozyme